MLQSRHFFILCCNHLIYYLRTKLLLVSQIRTRLSSELKDLRILQREHHQMPMCPAILSLLTSSRKAAVPKDFDLRQASLGQTIMLLAANGSSSDSAAPLLTCFSTRLSLRSQQDCRADLPQVCLFQSPISSVQITNPVWQPTRTKCQMSPNCLGMVHRFFRTGHGSSWIRIGSGRRAWLS